MRWLLDAIVDGIAILGILFALGCMAYSCTPSARAAGPLVEGAKFLGELDNGHVRVYRDAEGCTYTVTDVMGGYTSGVGCK